MKTYGVLLIGCGHIGMQHLMDIYFRDTVRIIAVADCDEALARDAARRCGAERYGTDYRVFLRDERVDIVIIATYTDSHLAILRDCLASHKHVLCEKPIAHTLEDGKTFVELVQRSPEKVLVAHILRHNQSYQRVRELLQSGVIGDLRLVRLAQNHHTVNWPRYCRLLEDCSPTVDCGVHYYDLLHWLTGAVITEVSGIGTKTQPDAPQENYTLATFRLSNGCIGFYEAGWGQSIRALNLKEFVGTCGRLTLEMQSQRDRDQEEGDRITVYRSDTGRYDTINLPSTYKDMYAQLETLINMIETDAPGNPTIEDVWISFQTALAVDQAIKTGATVRLEPLQDPLLSGTI